MFEKYKNISIFFECFFNIFFRNIEKKNLVFYKYSFNITYFDFADFIFVFILRRLHSTVPK